MTSECGHEWETRSVYFPRNKPLKHRCDRVGEHGVHICGVCNSLEETEESDELEADA